MMKMMDIKGIKKAFITLHCGLGNFHDIEVEDLTKHKMDSEEMHINADAVVSLMVQRKLDIAFVPSAQVLLRLQRQPLVQMVC